MSNTTFATTSVMSSTYTANKSEMTPPRPLLTM
jgi:hypothetical protein